MTRLTHSKESFFDLSSHDQVLVGDMTYVVEKAARGGMGFVLLLHLDTMQNPNLMSAFGLKLALKVILPDAADEEGLALFKRELTVWCGFRHWNIVWLLDIVDTGDAGWAAAMDWAIGSLEDMLKDRGKLSLTEGTYIMLHLIDGLSYAYTKDRVLHLDLKPANVLYHLNIDGLNDDSAGLENSAFKFRFMISDWGIASIKQPSLAKIAGLPPSAAREQYTLNNLGTENYMAPERFIKGFPSSVASDVFSLGMIYLKMLTGSLPFNTAESAYHALASGSYLTESAFLLHSENVPKSVQRLILSMIATSPSDRPDDYRSLRDQIINANNSSTGWFAKIFNW